MLFKVCTQYVSKFGKLSSGHRTVKGQFSFQFQRKAMPKNAHTTIQLCSFCMLVRLCAKSFKLGFHSTWTEKFQIYKLGFEKAQEPEVKLPAFAGSQRKQGNSRKKHLNYFFIEYPEPLTGWIIINSGKFLKRWEYQTTLPVFWETCMHVKKHQLELDLEHWTDSKLGKE